MRTTRLIASVLLAAVLAQTDVSRATAQSGGGARLLLSACYAAAEASHPALASRQTYDEIERLRSRNIDATWMPSLALGGQATYISDVPSVPFDLPDARSVSKDQYRIGLNVEQVVYAGGRPGARRRVEAASREFEQLSVDATIYSVRGQVDAAFFGALLQESVTATLLTARQSLETRMDEAAAGVREGVVAAGALDVLRVEIIRLDQQLIEARANRATALATLGTLTGLSIADDISLHPDTPAGSGRPEYEVFEAQRTLLAARAVLAGRQRRPTVAAVADVAYGRPPGQNFFEDSFDTFYNVGLSVRWQPFDWGRSRREVQEIEARTALIDAHENALERAIAVAADRLRGDIQRIEALIAQDEAIVTLRERITRRAAASLSQGTITATDFLLEENAERQARLARDLHTVQLAEAKARLATTVGGISN